MYLVHLSEGSSFFVFFSSALAEKLIPGEPLDSATLESLCREDERVRATEKALDLLSRSEHTSKMLFLKLLKRGFSEGIINEILERFESRGYIDNKRFAELFLSVKRRNRKEGRGKLRSRLIGKGVENGIIAEVVGDIDDDEEEEALVSAAEKLMRRKGMTKDKLYAGLVRRGFESRLIRRYIENSFQKYGKY